MMKALLATVAACSFALSAGPTVASDERELFIQRDLTQSPKEAVASIRDYVENNEDWLFLAEFGLKGGEVTALKVCYLPLGKDIFAAGMHVAAMMPCGHLAFYEEDGQSRLSMLNLAFMTTLHPDPNLERAVEKGAPAFEAMLDETLN